MSKSYEQKLLDEDSFTREVLAYHDQVHTEQLTDEQLLDKKSLDEEIAVSHPGSEKIARTIDLSFVE